jgi:hypothetical protein
MVAQLREAFKIADDRLVAVSYADQLRRKTDPTPGRQWPGVQ